MTVAAATTTLAFFFIINVIYVSEVLATSSDPLARFRGSHEFGSSNFGTWSTDEFDLPVYTYTGAEAAPGRLGPGKEPVIHHRIGNDRLEAVVYTNGVVSVRQDEGGPKLLNAYDPQKGQYRGGFGYVVDHVKRAIVGTTRAPFGVTPDVKNFSLHLGVNYALKVTWNESIMVRHRIFAPFGDVPFVYSQVNITNTGDNALYDISYIDYWAGKKQQLNCRHKPEATFFHRHEYMSNPPENFHGLLDFPTLNTTTARDRATPLPSYDDHDPRTTFHNCINHVMLSGYTTNGEAFFGDGGPTNPNIMNGLDDEIDAVIDDRAITSLATRFKIEPKETVVLCFTYGYLVNSSQTQFGPPVKNATADDCLAVFRDSQRSWQAVAPTMNFPGQLDWVQRELTWHSYMLRAGLTFDSFYNEHILNQNGNYLYVGEEQAAPRDPLTHVMGLLYGHGPHHPLVDQGIPSGVNYVKEVIRYTLKEKRPDGSIPWGQCAYGIDGFRQLDPSDLELQVIFTAVNYILARNDFDFLDQVVEWNKVKKTIGEMLWESFEHLVNVIRFGQHGLILLHTADHNDGILPTLGIKGSNVSIAEKMGESVMNSALGAYTLTLYEEILNYTGKVENASAVGATAESLRRAVDKTWDGRWFKRAWLGNESVGLGWRGDEEDGVMWTETQSWAILAGVPQLRLNRTAELVESISQLSIIPSPIAAINAGPKVMSDGGKGYGGVWYCGTLALISALGTAGYVDMALEEYLKASLANHAHTYPDSWFGVTGGPDVYNSILSDAPSSCRATYFPVLNSWSHTTPLASMFKLVGAEFHAGYVTLKPKIRLLRKYNISSHLLSIQKSELSPCSYSGHYHPDRPGEYWIHLYLHEDDSQFCKKISVNGKEWRNIELFRGLDSNGGKRIRFKGSVFLTEPLKWVLL